MSNLQEASDFENTVAISARRFEESPFIERTGSPKMVRGVYAGRYFAIYMGEDWMWDHLMVCGAPHGLEFSSTDALTVRRIEGGILGNQTDIDTTMTPFEAGLARFVDMDQDINLVCPKDIKYS